MRAASPLLDFLFERLLAKPPCAQWHEGSFDELQPSLVFGAQPLTLLCAEYPAGWSRWEADLAGADIAAIAARHEGVLDACSPAAMLVSFAQPSGALEMAMELQREARTRYQIALVTGNCLFARFELNGGEWRVLVGREVTRVEGLARRVAGGAVLVSPETFPLLEAHFAAGRYGGLLTAEFVDEMVTEATITMAPGAFSETSTFAGLGLT
jgi:hypothetical protein